MLDISLLDLSLLDLSLILLSGESTLYNKFPTFNGDISSGSMVWFSSKEKSLFVGISEPALAGFASISRPSGITFGVPRKMLADTSPVRSFTRVSLKLAMLASTSSIVELF